ncbi:MAG: hypothetical protein ACXVIJ_02685 [Thermoanaerobaculia bacterium]
MQLSIITLGNVHAEALEPLTPYFTRLEQLVLDVAPRDPFAKHRPELNRAIDAASADWLLILREREVIDAALAAEIGREVKEARVWGFRLRSIPWYAGKALHLGRDSGDVRLFHKRHYLRFANHGEWDELTVQGTVLRLENALRSITFESAIAHREYLAKSGVPHSTLRRVLLFVRYALSTRTADANTLRYLWIEAGYDKT